MNDVEFLDYCHTHAQTQRAGFTPDQLHRLFVLAGDPTGGRWNEAPKGYIEDFGHCRYHIFDRVSKARDLLT